MRAPHPTVLAQALEETARILRTQGTQAQRMATLLAARGYPTSTLGNGTRSSDTTTTTERAALNPNPWTGIDDQLTEDTHALLRATINHASLVVRILAHASDDDPIPAGTGTCLRCEKFCRPDAVHPENRIKAGFCPACYRQWLRRGQPDRSTFITSPQDEDAA